MGTRRRSRELALQALYYMDNRSARSMDSLDLFCENFRPSASAEPFLRRLVEGVVRHLAEIDAVIEQFSSNWRLGRMACVDRNILRIAIFELLYCPDIPPRVSINEAVDIGKKFGTEESGAFINGIVDGIRIAIEAGDLEAGETPQQQQKSDRIGESLHDGT